MKSHIFITTLMIGLACSSSFGRDQERFSVQDLRCEDLVDPIGIDVSQPRLSWRMRAETNGAGQTAYRILCATTVEFLKEGSADLWKSGKVDTDEFAPHVGQYDKRIFCVTYDVTDYLKAGRNAIGFWMGSGWSRG